MSNNIKPRKSWPIYKSPGIMVFDKDAIDGRDPWDDEITEAINPKPWIDLYGWAPKERKCTCGAEKTYGKGSHHSEWCDAIKL